MHPQARIPLILAAICFWWSTCAYSAFERQAATLNQDFLPVTSAFKISAVQTEDAVIVRFDAAAGYYLYQSKLSFTAKGRAAGITHPLLPAGEVKLDPYFGDVIIYRGLTEVRLPRNTVPSSGFELVVWYQGCAEKGLCYPPASTTFAIADSRAAPKKSQLSPVSLLQAFVAGGQLALTTPMAFIIPLLGGLLVVGRIAGTTFILTYALCEILKSWSAVRYGSSFSVHAHLQSAWVLVPLSAVLTGTAAYLAQPRQKLLTTTTRLLGAGGFLGFTAMCISSGYFTTNITQSLTALGEGGEEAAGLIAIAVHTAGSIISILTLAIACARPVVIWRYVQMAIPIMSLAVAIALLTRFIPGEVSLGLWSLLAVNTGYVGCRRAKVKVARAVSVLVLIFGLLGWVGMLKGGHDLSWPLHPSKWFSPINPAAPWVTVKNQAQLTAELAQARVAGIPSLIQWDADWCVSCKNSPAVSMSDDSQESHTRSFKLLRVDVTSGSADSRELLKLHGLLVPGALEVVTGNPSDSPRRIVGQPTPSEVTSLISAALAPLTHH